MKLSVSGPGDAAETFYRSIVDDVQPALTIRPFGVDRPSGAGYLGTFYNCAAIPEHGELKRRRGAFQKGWRHVGGLNRKTS